MRKAMLLLSALTAGAMLAPAAMAQAAGRTPHGHAGHKSVRAKSVAGFDSAKKAHGSVKHKRRHVVKKKDPSTNIVDQALHRKTHVKPQKT